jgi:DNA-binding HxlR family transcriptional regulator
MNSTNSSANPCPIARALDVLGDAWSMLILRDAAVGLTRFDEFRKSLGIAPTMLTKRLAALTEEQLLEKRLYSERPPREEHEDRPAALRGAALHVSRQVGTSEARISRADAIALRDGFP